MGAGPLAPQADRHDYGEPAVTGLWKALLVLLSHVAIVLGIAAKARYDRDTLPRAWVKTVPADPDHPLRGRYVRLVLQVGSCGPAPVSTAPAHMLVRDGKLCAEAAPDEPYGPTLVSGPGGTRLAGEVMFYIPEHAEDPSRRPHGEELWVEVAVSEHGLPRPIRLGVKKGDGPIVEIR